MLKKTTKKTPSLESYEVPVPRRGDLMLECRARVPTKGIRTRLRTLLRSQGVTGKFRTDERRDGSLVIIGRSGPIETTVTEFEGRKVISRK